MKRLMLIAALALLSACSGGTPLPPPGPPPSPTPRPGVPVVTADWTAPLGLSQPCGGPGLSDPFGCSLPSWARWGALPQDGNGGLGCVDPEPNVCFQPDGLRLNFHSGDPGMALVWGGTVPRGVISIEAEITATLDCSTPVSYVGPVLYDGEGPPGNPTGNYFAFYYTCGAIAGPPQPQLLAYVPPTMTQPVSPRIYPNGSSFRLRMDYVRGERVDFMVDDITVFSVTPATPGVSPVFNADPHPALWFGNVTGAIGRFDVYAAP
jgi:hypothetical protein